MKNIFNFTALLLLFTMFYSCQKNEIISLEQKDHNCKVLKSALNMNHLYPIKEQIKSRLFGLRSSGGNLSEEEAMALLLPFIEEGATFREEILDFMEMGNFPENEIEDINNLPEEVFAELSFILAATNDEPPVNTENGDVTPIEVIDCIVDATGLSTLATGINALRSGTSALITAQTGLQVIKALGTRYLGYIGLAYSIYRFVNCIVDAANNDEEIFEEEEEEEIPCE